MKRMIVAAAVLCATGAAFPHPHHVRTVAAAHCASCGTVQEVHTEQRKGSGGPIGVVGGALVGGLLGHQVGGGTGNTLATIGGAAAGGYVGNEVQKRVNGYTVWITTVRMNNGTVRRFEETRRPAWGPGSAVRVTGQHLRRL